MRSDFWSLPYAAQRAIRRGERSERRARHAGALEARLAEAAITIERLSSALELALPIIEAEREIMWSSYVHLSGPNKGKVTGDEKAIIDQMDAAMTAALQALSPSPAHKGQEHG